MGKTNLQIGDVVREQYLIKSVLGQGGVGTVYLAEDLKLQGKVWAIKEAPIGGALSQQVVSEAKMLVNLDHPQLPDVIDWFTMPQEGFIYLVREYVEGKTLKQIFEENQNLSYQQIVKYCIQICELLNYLHNQKPKPIIYRDLKPANVMIDHDDNVKLIDFGIARAYKDGQEGDTIQIGTIGFAAPEQFERIQTDERSDLFSLGAMLYYLLSKGKFIYTTERPLDHLRRNLPTQLIACIRKLVHLNPDYRYQSAQEVKSVLQAILDKTPHPKQSRNSRRARRVKKVQFRYRYAVLFTLLIGVIMLISPLLSSRSAEVTSYINSPAHSIIDEESGLLRLTYFEEQDFIHAIIDHIRLQNGEMISVIIVSHDGFDGHSALTQYKDVILHKIPQNDQGDSDAIYIHTLLRK